jgi:tetraacyldisaccharide 4'-kinase
MPLHTPRFWQSNGWLAHAMQPLAVLYTLIVRLRGAISRRRIAPVPVICVGNVVAGGAGKTPTTQAILRLLQDWGISPYVVARGYGGRLTGPVRVDIAAHGPAEVGDEPLMHAAIAPTIISRNRYRGVKMAAEAGARAVLMDDGLQNRTLAPNFSFLVLDGAYGLGNGRVMPAGPLREPLKSALQRSSAAILIGEDKHNLAAAVPSYIPLIRAHIEPDQNAARLLKGCRVIAFCGLARPEKFFDTMRSIGAEVMETIAFPDHHLYQSEDLQELIDYARSIPAYLVTTQKDWVNIPTRFHGHIQTLPIRLKFEDEAAVQKLILPVLVGGKQKGAA